MEARTAESAHVRFPVDDAGLRSQDREWCEVIEDGEPRTIRFHDYGEIFSVPGLYERIFYDELDCRSPAEVVGVLATQLGQAGVAPSHLSVIDLGAGNGIVGEELRTLGAASVVGIDILEEAAAAAMRDRPDVYDDYVVCDLTRLDGDDRDRLGARRPNCLSTVAALGFDDIPPRAFAEAFNLVSRDGWIAFNIKADFLERADETGFRALILRMLGAGVLEERARRVYAHRLAVTGEPLEYVALVGRKRRDIPAGWA